MTWLGFVVGILASDCLVFDCCLGKLVVYLASSVWVCVCVGLGLLSWVCLVPRVCDEFVIWVLFWFSVWL